MRNVIKKASVLAMVLGFAIQANSSDLGQIHIKSVAPYAATAPIAPNIKQECIIDKQLVEYIVQYATERGINIVTSDSIKSSDVALEVSITDAVSSGNAFTGHRKFTTVEGSLVKNNKKIASFRAGRVSGGGAFGGFKGSCAVLGRTVQAIGKDIGGWLTNPNDGAILGDAYLFSGRY